MLTLEVMDINGQKRTYSWYFRVKHQKPVSGSKAKTCENLETICHPLGEGTENTEPRSHEARTKNYFVFLCVFVSSVVRTLFAFLVPLGFVKAADEPVTLANTPTGLKRRRSHGFA